jgi:hypothetical protein
MTNDIRVLRHERGNPETGLARSLPGVQRHRTQVDTACRKGDGVLTAVGESDQLIVLGGWESHPHGEGADSHPQPARGT